MKEIAIRFGIVIIVAYMMLLGAMVYYQRSLMYFPQPALPDYLTKKLLPKTVVPIEVKTADNISLHGFLIPPKDKTKMIILAFHGNGSLAPYLASNFEWAMEEGYGVLLAEYRGYGGNAGKPTEDGLYQDADAYLNYLHTHYPDNKIVAYGQSLGGAVAVDLVARNQNIFSGLILEAPFDSAVNVADKIYPSIILKRWLLRDKYLSNEKIGNISIPKLFLLAEQDDVVGFDSGMNLFDAAKDPKQIRVYHEASHMMIFQYGAINDVMDFLGSLQQ